MIDTMDIIQCQSDTCFFRDDNNELFIGVYVDDILFVCSEDVSVCQFLMNLSV